MKIEQRAGRFTLVSFTDGHPVFSAVEFEGREVMRHLSINDLHDLRYAIDRQIVQVENASKR